MAENNPVTNSGALEEIVRMTTQVCQSIPKRALYRHLERDWRHLKWLIVSLMGVSLAVLVAFFIFAQVVLATDATTPYQFRGTVALVEAGIVLLFLTINAYIITRELCLSRQEWLQRVQALVQRINPRQWLDPFPTLVAKPTAAAIVANAGPTMDTSITALAPEFGSAVHEITPMHSPRSTDPLLPHSAAHNVYKNSGSLLTKTPLNPSISAYLVLREGQALLIPSTLLCQGDYVVLDLGDSLPGDATYVGPWLNQQPTIEPHLGPQPFSHATSSSSMAPAPILRAGHVFNSAYLVSRGIPVVRITADRPKAPLDDLTATVDFRCCQHVFRLDATPFSDDLRSALAYEGCPNSVLDNQIYHVARLFLCTILPICLFLSLAANVLRLVLLSMAHAEVHPQYAVPPPQPTAATEPADHSWQYMAMEYLGTWQVYLLLPFCAMVLPMLTVLARTYANAQILILLDALQRSKTEYEDSEDIDEFDMDAPPPTKDVTISQADVWNKFVQLLSMSDYRNLSRSNRLVESLGNTTVICSVDRDGTLTKPFPAVDQIMFINRNNTMVSIDVAEDKMYSNGVTFEDDGWEQHLTSLKPLGLNFLLNSNCGASSGLYLIDPHRRRNPLQRYCKVDSAQQTCLCRVGHEIGFTNAALASFTRCRQICVVAPCHPSTPVLTALQDAAVPSVVSTLYREVISESYQLMSDGQVPLVLDLCSDYWDGEKIQPLTLDMKQEIMELYQNALENDIQTLAFAYRPVDPMDIPEAHFAATTVPASATSLADASLCLELTPEDHRESSWRWVFRKPARPCSSYQSTDSVIGRTLSLPSSPGKKPEASAAGATQEMAEQVASKGDNVSDGDGSFETTTALPFVAMEGHQYYTVEQAGYKSLIRNQVFLGLTTLCPVPKSDVCDVIEDLGLAGIRFVYFSQARERESKAFAERLGLETDWNACILLSSDASTSSDSSTNHGEASNAGNDALHGCPGEQHLSHPQPYAHHHHHEQNPFLATGYLEDHDIKAQLPRGIENIRPHLENVDDIPLQVSLFAEANWQAVREMLRIYQEEGEVVCCIGSGLKASNPMTFATADFGIAVDPYPMGFRGLYRPQVPPTAAPTPATSTHGGVGHGHSNHNHTSTPNHGPSQPQLQPSSPLAALTTARDFASSFFIGAGFVSLPCSLTFQHDTSLYVLTQIIREARWLLACIRQGGAFIIGMHLSVVMGLLMSYAMLLPPMFQGLHILWLLCFTVPLYTIPFLFVEHEATIMTTMVVKNQTHVQDRLRLCIYAILRFAPLVAICAVTYLIALQALLPLDTDAHNDQGGNGYRALYTAFVYVDWTALSTGSQWAVWYAQTLTSCVFTYMMILVSSTFLSRTQFVIEQRPWRSIPWIICSVALLAAQGVFATVALAPGPSSFMERLPWYYFFVALVGPWCLVVPVQELTKWHDRRQYDLFQKRSKLEFNTKLGLHSPI
ncbi:hypothetical protein H4R34_000527 [Dimargaris verticillata]|uniref:Cation-transporting P-type ATPase C-terminal domain-containing protein n=1 Tax=Dimargaris verticillata TaxID=2761393 RepID=A0A9W8BBM2_9FUNG|nr:hypothetical protein H4R34_000527 [Dimargaris verticillata]